MLDIFSDPDTGLVIGQAEYGSATARATYSGATRTPWPDTSIIEMRGGDIPGDPDTPPEPPLPFLREAAPDEWRAAARTLVETLYAAAINTITGHAAQADINTWTLKKQMADDFNSSDSARRAEASADLAAMLSDAEASALGLQSEQDRAAYMASRILTKAAIYRAATRDAERGRRDGKSAIAAIVDEASARAVMAAIEASAVARLESFMANMQGGAG